MRREYSVKLDATWAFILTLVFFILKVTGTIAWSWVWILSPLWIFTILCVVVILLVSRANKY
jgi:hypothetical protein